MNTPHFRLFILVLAFSLTAVCFAAEDPFEPVYNEILSQISQPDQKKVGKQVKSVSNRSPIAMMTLSTFRKYGMFGEDRDSDDAFQCLEKAAKKGFRPAIYQVARAYYVGNAGKKGANDKKAFDYCSDAKIMHLYAVLLESSDEDELKKAVRQLKARQDGDHAVVLAYCLLRGNVLEQNYEEAFQVLETSCKRNGNHGESLFALSQCYRDGIGTDRDQAKSDEYLKKALDAGNPQALFYVLSSGTAYAGRRPSRRSDGTEQNFATGPQIYDFDMTRTSSAYIRPDQADRPILNLLTAKHIESVRKLAEAGDTAMVCLMYDVCKYGIGVKEDEAQAEFWYGKRKYYHLLGHLPSMAYSSRRGPGKSRFKEEYAGFPDNREKIMGNSVRRHSSSTAKSDDDSDADVTGSVASATRQKAKRRTIVTGEAVGDEEWNSVD